MGQLWCRHYNLSTIPYTGTEALGFADCAVVLVLRNSLIAQADAGDWIFFTCRSSQKA
jgi:hypothetical protein